MWIGPDGAVRYASAYPPPLQPAPPRRRRWPIWVTLGVVGVLLLCVAPAAFVASRLPLLPAADRAEAANPSPTPAPSPQANSPARVRTAWVTDQIRTALDAQAAAMVKGDQRAFLAVADPKASKVTAALKRRFGSLRALRVTTYTQKLSSFPSEGGTARRPVWKVKVEIQYCLVIRDCLTDALTVDTDWAETAAGLRMTALGQSGDADNGPRPWEVSSLRTAVGKRVVLATTSRYASRLPALLREADRAAAMADRFVIGQPPDRYRIFIAGPSDWKRWYGGDLPSWSVGFATSVSNNRMEVVLNLGEIQANYVDEVLRHELGHVATLSGDHHGTDSDFWLVEGIAEYIQESGRPVRRYDGRAAVSRYLDSGAWDGNVNVPQPTSKTPDLQVAARYGIGYYAVRRMSERFGQAKMIEFFSAVVLKSGDTLDTAARKAFGVSWANVNADCARYVRRQA
jgi:hypothetical protein